MLEVLPIEGMPEVRGGDDLAALVVEAALARPPGVLDGDVLVVAQKVVSKAEGRLRDLKTVQPGRQAQELARRIDGDPRLVEVVLEESVLELAGMICEVVGAPYRIQRIDRRDIDNVQRRVVNIERSRRILRWAPRVTLPEGLRYTYEWLSGMQ